MREENIALDDGDIKCGLRAILPSPGIDGFKKRFVCIKNVPMAEHEARRCSEDSHGFQSC